MKLVVFLLLHFLVFGCAVSSPSKDDLYQGEKDLKILIVPKSEIVIREDIKVELAKNKSISVLADAFIEYDKYSNAFAIKRSLELTNKVGVIEVATSKNINQLNYDLVIKATGKQVPTIQKTNCDFFFYITTITLGIVPSVCSERYLYSAVVSNGDQNHHIEYEYVSTTVNGWLALLLKNFDGWGNYYERDIADENFGQRLLNATLSFKP